jgi:hypothetical protein
MLALSVMSADKVLCLPDDMGAVFCRSVSEGYISTERSRCRADFPRVISRSAADLELTETQ